VTRVQVDDRVENGVRVAIHYDAGIYDGSCALTVTAAWANLDTGASGSSDITAVSTIDGHYGFIGYANTTFETGSGTVVVTLSSHPGAALRIAAGACSKTFTCLRHPVAPRVTWPNSAQAPRRLHPRHAPFKEWTRN